MIKALLWKEWQQQRWKLAFGCVLLAGYTMIGVQTRLLPDIAVIVSSIFLGSIVLPIFVSMGLVAAERSDGTLRGLLALPVKARTIFAVKVAMGAAACIVPIVCSFAVVSVMTRGREESLSRVLHVYVAMIALAVLMLTWTTCLGGLSRSEARVGMTGLAILVGWWLWAVMIEAGEIAGARMWAMHPFAVIELLEGGGELLSTAVMQTVTVAGLWVLGAWRFGRIGRKES
jgi:hypothetical protein